MATVIFGSGVAGIRGKLGGAVFSANQSSCYAKQYVKPVYRRATMQLPLRAQLAKSSAEWTYLSNSDRTDWDNFAAAPNELDYDAWGNQIFLSGYYWFCRCQQRRYYIDPDVQPLPPAGGVQTPLSDLTLDIRPYSVGDSYVEWSAPALGATDALIVEIAISDNISNKRPRSWYLLVMANVAETSPANITLGVAFRFGELTPTSTMAYCRAWNQSFYGNRSVVAETSSIVAAA
jgi:hypothetical protein